MSVAARFYASLSVSMRSLLEGMLACRYHLYENNCTGHCEAALLQQQRVPCRPGGWCVSPGYAWRWWREPWLGREDELGSGHNWCSRRVFCEVARMMDDVWGGWKGKVDGSVGVRFSTCRRWRVSFDREGRLDGEGKVDNEGAGASPSWNTGRAP